jgi:hypothetical protein
LTKGRGEMIRTLELNFKEKNNHEILLLRNELMMFRGTSNCDTGIKYGGSEEYIVTYIYIDNI